MYLGEGDSGSRDHSGWDHHIGAIWAQVLHGLDSDGEVAEVGPGFTVKVGLGLKEYGFRGSLYVIEPNPQVLQWILPRYRELLPLARVIPVAMRLRSAGSVIPPRLNAVLMNHLLDDLVLDAITPQQRCDAIFREMRTGTPCRAEVRSAWQTLAADPAKLAFVGQTVINDICSFCQQVRPALLGVSQYPSWFQAQSNLGLIDKITAPLLRQLARHLPKAGFRGPRLRRYGGKEARWLVLHSQEVEEGYGERSENVFRDHAFRQEEGLHRRRD